MSYTQIPSNPFTVPGSAAGFLDIRKRGTTGPVVTVAVPAYAGGTGAPLSFAPANADYFNNARNISTAGSTWRNPYARLKINASGAGAGSLVGFGHNYPVQVYVQKNGAHYLTLNDDTQNQQRTLNFSLDGPGEYTFFQGQQTSPGDAGDVGFSNIESINFDGSVGATKLPVTRASKLVIIRGDSVSVAGYSQNPIRYGLAVLVQPQLANTDVLTIGYGGKQGYLDMQNATTRTALLNQVAAICALYQSVSWYECCGINDAQAASIPAATWASATATGLTYLHNNIPNLTKVYWASPTPVANVSTVGPSGNKYSDFQAAVQPAVAQVGASWLQYVDGNSLGVTGTQGTGLGQTVDGTHPNDQTYIALAQNVANVLNGVTSSLIYGFTPTSGVAGDGSTWASSRGNLVFSQADAAKRASFSAAGAVFGGSQVYVSNAPSFVGLSSISVCIQLDNFATNTAAYAQNIVSQTIDANGSWRILAISADNRIYLAACTAPGGDNGPASGKRFRITPLSQFAGQTVNIYANITLNAGDGSMTLLVNETTAGTDLAPATGLPNIFNNEPITLGEGLGGTIKKFAYFNRALSAAERSAYFTG
jgi:hypothetical protein